MDEGRDVVFVSYSHADRPWLDRLQVLLAPLVRNKRLVLWADPFLQVGDDWHRGLSRAIDRAGSAVLLVSGDFLASEFIMAEELPALVARGVRLAPVLLRECLWDYEPQLRRVQWAHDPGRDGPLDRGGDTPAERDGRLVRVCRRLIEMVDIGAAAPAETDPAPALPGVSVAGALVSSARPGPVDGVPPLPPGYVVRDDLDALLAAVVRTGTGAVGVTGNAAALGLHGQGGIGKSVLAAAVARDERVRAYFPDGVFWVTVGEQADVVAAQVDLLRRLGRSGAEVRSAGEGLRLLREALAQRRVLLVVDDVWSEADAAAFRAAGSQGRVLYTSRDERVLGGVGADVRQVEVLPEAAARHLLARISGTAIDDLPAEAGSVLTATGRVPLALALVAAAIRGGMTWPRLAAELERGSGTFLDHPYANTFKAMQVATAALPDELWAAALSLAVYPPDTAVPVRAIVRFWTGRHGVPADEVRADLGALAEAELLRLIDDHVTFHDLQHDYLVLQAEDRSVLHGDLLAAYRQLLPAGGRDGWWQLPADEPYIGNHLIHHLRLAGDRAGIRAAVTDPAFLTVRVARDGVHAAESDLTAAAEVIPDDPVIAALRRWLTRHAHLFAALDGVGDVAATVLCWLAGAEIAVASDRLGPLLPARCLQPLRGLIPLSSASLRTLTGHTHMVVAVAFSPDGRLLASAGNDGTVRLWETATGEQRAALSADTVSAVAFSPDGRLVAGTGNDGTVRLWDTTTGEQAAELKGHTGGVKGVAFAPDGSLLATAGGDWTVRLWEVGTGRQRASLVGHTGGVNGVAFAPGGSLLASAGNDGTVRLWEVPAGRQHAVLDGHVEQVNGVAFAPGGRLLASAGSDGTVRLWEVGAGRERAELLGHGDWVRAVAFSPDGRLLASGGDDSTVHLRDTDTNSLRTELIGHTDWVRSVAFSPDGRLLASASDDWTVRLWDADTSGRHAETTGHIGWTVVGLSFDGKLLASAGDQGLRLLDATTGEQLAQLSADIGPINAVAFSPDSSLLADAGGNGAVWLWEVDTGAQPTQLSGPTRSVNAVAFSPDQRRLAGADSDGSVRLWDTATGEQRAELPGHVGEARAVIFSPDGLTLASAYGKGMVWLWDVSTGEQRAQLDGHTDGVNAVTFSPDGRLLASAGGDGTVRLWDAATGEHRARLDGHADAVSAVAFSPGGHLMASADAGGTVILWDLDRFAVIHRLPLGRQVVCMVWAGPLISVFAAKSVVALQVIESA